MNLTLPWKVWLKGIFMKWLRVCGNVPDRCRKERSWQTSAQLLRYRMAQKISVHFQIIFQMKMDIFDKSAVVDGTVLEVMQPFIPTQDTVSKWVYNFWPANTLCAYQDIFHSFKHHIGGGQQQKSCTKSSKP